MMTSWMQIVGGRGRNLRFGAKDFVNAISGKILMSYVLERMRSFGWMIKIIEILSVVEHNTIATHANLVYFSRPIIIREIFNIHSNHCMMFVHATLMDI